MISLVLNSIVVFSLTLILTKSKVLAGKREFVQTRYEAAKVNDEGPSWLHRWWHSWWTCPMCSGFWVGLVICWFFPVYSLFVDLMVVFGLNWLIHTLENILFFTGQVMENISDIPLSELADNFDKTLSEHRRHLR